jgi:hypothetical protein
MAELSCSLTQFEIRSCVLHGTFELRRNYEQKRRVVPAEWLTVRIVLVFLYQFLDQLKHKF